jgi:thiol:disulfide interchange protein
MRCVADSLHPPFATHFPHMEKCHCYSRIVVPRGYGIRDAGPESDSLQRSPGTLGALLYPFVTEPTMKSGRCFLIFLGVLMLWSVWQGSSVQADFGEGDLLKYEIKVDEFTVVPENSSVPVKVRRGQVVKIVFTGTPKPGHHTFPLTKRTARQSNLATLKFGKVKGITPLYPINETPDPVPHKEDMGKVGFVTWLEHYDRFTWEQSFLIGTDAPPGALILPIKLKTQVCTNPSAFSSSGFCFPFHRDTNVTLEISDDSPLPPNPDLTPLMEVSPVKVVTIRGEEEIPEPATKAPTPAKIDKSKTTKDPSNLDEGLIKVSHEEYQAKIRAIEDQTEPRRIEKKEGFSELINFMLLGVFWGAISLVTPCVFPMIPITVSFFLKQSEKEHHRPVVMASVYSLTIVVVLTLAAAFLLAAFRWLSVHPVTNYFLGGLFVFFALSLFGMYEIELPNFLARFTSAREGRGGMVGTIFMALTFTIISFACVAPFLGGFGGTAAGARPMWHNLLGGLAFSATFASPFFFLAIFPSLLRKMPKSGSWLNSVKVVMGFLELAAAFKFFRSAELILTIGDPSLFTFDFVLGVWIALCLLAGLYLLGVFRLPHDSPEDHISVPKLLFSAAFIGLAFYMAPALLKLNTAGQPQRPGGTIYAWINSFLLPEFQGGDSEIPHTGNLDYAVALSREELRTTNKPKRIFIDFTGTNCTNCNLNENNVFSRPGIAKLFEPYIVVKMYTDIVPERYYAPEAKVTKERSGDDAKDVNLAFQDSRFSNVQLPLYVILEPDLQNHIRVIGIYEEGLINNVAEFAGFLKNPEKYQKNH